MKVFAPLAVVAGLLFGSALISVAVGHQAFLEGCVCIVNAILRALIALGASIIFGAVGFMVKERHTTVSLCLALVQALSLALGIFFLVQHAFFLLEAA